MGERADCPFCTRGSTALTKRGLLAYHNGRYGVPCPAGGLTVDEARAKKAFDERTKNPRRAIPPRPTVQVMDGETGENDCGGPILYLRFTDTIGLRWRWWFVNRSGAPWLDPSTVCPAPTPRAP